MLTLGPYTLGPNDTPENGVYVGDARELARAIPDESVDLIFTDPPWDNNSVVLYDDLAQMAIRILKPGSLVFAYTGNDWLPRIMQAMSNAGLSWLRMFAGIQLASNNRYFRKRLFVKWRPIVVYVKGEYNPKSWLPDALPTNRDKRYHPRGQGAKPVLRWIQNASPPNAIVLDPFVGGGTFIAVCKMLSRRFLAFDIDSSAADIARQHVRDTQPPLFVLKPKQGDLL